jgi:hypothetical protein
MVNIGNHCNGWGSNANN